MRINKKLSTSCIIEKVTCVSKNTCKEFTTYRIVFPELNTSPVFLSYKDKASMRLGVLVDVLGNDENK